MAMWLTVNERIVFNHIVSSKKRIDKIKGEKDRHRRWNLINNLVIATARELRMKLSNDEISSVKFALDQI